MLLTGLGNRPREVMVLAWTFQSVLAMAPCQPSQWRLNPYPSLSLINLPWGIPHVDPNSAMIASPTSLLKQTVVEPLERYGGGFVLVVLVLNSTILCSHLSLSSMMALWCIKMTSLWVTGYKFTSRMKKYPLVLLIQNIGKMESVGVYIMPANVSFETLNCTLSFSVWPCPAFTR